MGQSCSGMAGPCPECRESCRDNCLCVCHQDEPCVDRCCNLCCQFCLDGCCLICSDDCRYTLCFTCTRIADSCAAVLTTEQPRSTEKPREGSNLEEGQVKRGQELQKRSGTEEERKIKERKEDSKRLKALDKGLRLAMEEDYKRPPPSYDERGCHVWHVYSNVCLTQSPVDHLFQISHPVVAISN
ncbi:hypothetical protein Q8A67_001096 [Cirrhinus molitorella]|nr:hypothetical protein Q8A67_001096 [Cirrhinus molitorella]